MEIDDLSKLLHDCWSYETCSPGLKEIWDDKNSSIGQCAITALIVNDFFGGEIMRCMSSTGSHYYNLINNSIVDLTVNQFFGELPLYNEGEKRTREYLLSNKDTRERDLLLLNCLKKKTKYFDKIYKLDDLLNSDYKDYTTDTMNENKKLKYILD